MADNRKFYEIEFQLNAQTSNSYNRAFNSAQNPIIQMQKEIAALSKAQSNITAYEKQQAAIDSTKKKLEVLQQQYDNIQKEISETGAYSSDLENKLLAKQQQIDKTNISIDAQTDKLNRMGNALHAAGINTETLRAEEAKLGGQIDELKQKQEAAAAKANNFGAVASAAFGAVGQAIVSAGIISGLKEMYEWFGSTAKASMEFESAITGVAKTTDMSGSELAKLSGDIKELSTQIPVGTTELADITEAAGQLGIQKDALLEFTEVMANLGVATNLSSMDASTALAKFANVVRMSSEDYGRLGSVIVDLGNKGASTESEIVEMATRLASTGALIGLSEPEIMAVASSMSSLGIEAEAGGSAISKLLKQFEVMVQTGAPELADFAKVAGMSAEEFSAAWGENSVEALSKFVDGLGRIDAAGGSSVATLEDLGITEVRMSNAVLSLASSGGILTDSLETANAAWKDNTALAKEAEKRYATTESQLKMMQDEYNNLRIAIGDNYTPILRELYEVGTQVFSGMEDIAKEYPFLVQGATAFIGVVATATAGLTAYAAIAKVVKMLELASVFTGPAAAVIGVVAGVAALTAGIVALTEASKTEADEVRYLTESSREQYKELQELNSEYEHIVELHGENSDEARQLRWQIEDLTDEYEKSKQTVEEFTNQMEETVKASQELRDSHSAAIDEIDKEEYNTIALINKLAELSKQNEDTAASHEQMEAIIDALNAKIPKLNLNYDEVISKGVDFVDSLKSMAEAEAAQKRYNQTYTDYVGLLSKATDIEKGVKKAEDDLTGARDRAAKADEAYWDELQARSMFDTSGMAGFGMMFSEEAKEANAAQKEVEGYEKSLADAKEELQKNKKEQEDAVEIFKEYAGVTGEATEGNAALGRAISDVTEKVDDLAKKYTEAYNAALESLQGQYSLWDEAAKVVATSAGTMNDNLEGQISYWQKYNENLANLTNKSADIEGLQEMLASFADGSEESVNAIAGMAKASDSDLKEMVKNWQTLRTEQENVSNNLANLETDFKDSMNALQKELETTIGNMKLGEEAAQSGQNAMQGFIKGAEDMLPEVQAAYTKLGQAAIAAMKEALDSHSPSRVMWEIGKYAMKGFTGGVEAMEPDVAAAMKSAANTGVDAFGANAINAESGGGGVSISLDYSPQYDLGNGNSASEIEAMLRTHDNDLRNMLLDLLESLGIYAKRGVYT